MRIGTRRSELALAQAKLIAEQLRDASQGECEIVPMLTGGDAGAGAQDKSRWVTELEQALASGEIDLAVHSAKDVPSELADGLELLGAPGRASAEDVLCGVGAVEELPRGARVGTSSIRRVAQLCALRSDLQLVAIHGNVDTRLRKLAEGSEQLAAIVLARAGLQRLGRDSEIGVALDARHFVPAPGQGTLALEGRAGDERARAAVRAITDASAFACLLAERALARDLNASCNTPLGAHATPVDEDRLLLRAWVGLPDGSAWASDEQLGRRPDPETLGRHVAERLNAAGARALLREAEEMVSVGRA